MRRPRPLTCVVAQLLGFFPVPGRGSEAGFAFRRMELSSAWWKDFRYTLRLKSYLPITHSHWGFCPWRSRTRRPRAALRRRPWQPALGSPASHSAVPAVAAEDAITPSIAARAGRRAPSVRRPRRDSRAGGSRRAVRRTMASRCCARVARSRFCSPRSYGGRSPPAEAPASARSRTSSDAVEGSGPSAPAFDAAVYPSLVVARREEARQPRSPSPCTRAASDMSGPSPASVWRTIRPLEHRGCCSLAMRAPHSIACAPPVLHSPRPRSAPRSA